MKTCSGRVAGALAALTLGASMGRAESETVERKGPLAGLPSEPKGEHLAKIAALGDNEWVDLGQPAPDPKWGLAPGRSWTPVMPYAPDLRGAFLFGEGTHGFVKPDGHYMDDLWFYDVNQHRWICVYPGIHAKEGYKEIAIDEKTGFELGPDGFPVPIAEVGHGYGAQTYDIHRRRFMSMPTFRHYWRRAIHGRADALAAAKDIRAGEGRASPWIYDAVNGHWNRFRTENRPADAAAGTILIYVPTVRRAFGYRRWNSRIAWYDPETNDWIEIQRKGDRTPWNVDVSSCYDSRRDRIYLGGGLYGVVPKGESALWMFDVQTETFTRLQPEGAPPSNNFATNRARMQYDSVNDVVVLIQHRDDAARGVHVYHPEENRWETVCVNSEPLRKPGVPYAQWNGYYDPELNVHIQHVAGDSRQNGRIYAYRYKRQGATP